MARPRIIGVASTKRLIRRLPAAANEEMRDVLTTSGQIMLARAKAEAPVRTGGLRNALAFKLLKGAALTLKLGLLTKRTKRRFFYGYILDNGRKAQRVRARRRGGTPYYINVRAIDPERYNFVFGQRRYFRENILPKVRTVWESILKRAASGVGYD